MNGRDPLPFVAILVGVILGFGQASSPARGQTDAESLSASFRKAAERVTAAVVSVRPLDPSLLNPVPNSPIGPIRPFGGTPRSSFRVGDAGREPMGSGVVVDAKNGYILTNDHVLLGSSRAAVVLADGRERKTSEIRRDPGVDLAVLVVDPAGLNSGRKPSLVTSSGSARPGDWVLSIGQPGGSSPALSSEHLQLAARSSTGTPGGIRGMALGSDAAVNLP